MTSHLAFRGNVIEESQAKYRGLRLHTGSFLVARLSRAFDSIEYQTV